MSAYTEDQLKKLRKGLGESILAVQRQQVDFVRLTLESEKAAEFATHGYSRRLSMLVHCAKRVFECLPPGLSEVPDKSRAKDATVYIQTFVFNTFGALDNLAWLWVEETRLTGKNKKSLSRTQIGLRKNCTEIRSSFNLGLGDYLASLDEWFENLEDFRHSLAHRVPLYIAPYLIDPIHEDAHNSLENQKSTIWRKINSLGVSGGNESMEHLGAIKALDSAQVSLGHFKPLMQHSFSESSPNVMIHPQIIADLLTVYEIGSRLLRELEAFSEKRSSSDHPDGGENR